MTPKITYAGLALMVQAMNGSGITFTKVKIGNGAAPSDYMTATDLSNPIYEAEFTAKEEKEQFLSLSYYFTNSDIGSDLNWTELGIFAQNPTGGDDLLYAYAHYTLSGDAQPQYIPAADSEVFEVTETVDVYVGNSENVSAILAESSEYLTKTKFNEHVNSENPHPNMGPAAVGLEKVPNVSTNDQTPTYDTPTSLSNLKSGERLSVAMGKIAAAVKAFITHSKDTSVHVTTTEKAGWNGKAAASHNHKAADVNAGVFGVARGGTGLSTLAKGRVFYASSTSAIAQLAQATDASQVLMQHSTGNPFWGSICQTGTYTGGGKTGSGSPNSILFKGCRPKVVLIMQHNYDRFGILILHNNTYCEGISVVGGVHSKLKVSQARSGDDTTVSWYYDSAESHPANQLDHSGYTFVYVGIK